MTGYLGSAWIAPAVVAMLLTSFTSGSATPIGINIVVNSGAETGVGSASGNDIEVIPAWTTTSNFTVVQYGAPAFPDATVSSAIGGGSNFFSGGPSNASSTANQTLNIGDLASAIDAGSISATLSAFLGGFDGQDDNMTLTATFLDGSSHSLGLLSIGPVTEPDRAGATTLLARTGFAAIPIGTRAVDLSMVATRLQGSYDDGYADNLSLVLSDSAIIAVPEPASLSVMLAALASIALFSRRNRAQL